MKSRLASVRAGGGLDRVNCAVRSLDDEWQKYGEVDLERFWARERFQSAAKPADALVLLAELVKADLRCRFEKGQTPTVAAYLDRFPELRAADSRVVSLVYEEFCLHEERGRAPDVDSFCDRYPDWKSSLASQLRYHQLFSRTAGPRAASPCFPEAGENFEEFRLHSLLGTGGMSRVFLANDLSLGGKQVVLKVTVDRGQEPKVQGPLDHPHIVPVNAVVYQTKGDLCGLSMPYRPGLPLDEVITRVDPSSRPRKAIALWDALVSGTKNAARSLALADSESDQRTARLALVPRGDGWEGFPARGTYAQGVAWIIMILARALHYAHRRRTFHRDVKPGNLLLTLQYGPQLLDFNLAESPHSANHAQAALHGGTLPYMAPEQIEAFLNPELWGRVGASADIYSLGLVFRELLTGQKPEVPDQGMPPARALRAVLDQRPLINVAVSEINPAIPRVLEAIVAKCLAFSADDRYPDAQALERDLELFLTYRPLKHAVNPSPRERVGNWIIRNRRVVSIAASVVVLGALFCGYWINRPNPVEASPAFRAAVRDLNNGDCPKAIKALSRLEIQNPKSCLVKFYLGFALMGDPSPKKRSDADTMLHRALVAFDGESTMAAWAVNHREVIDYLIDFAESRIIQADTDAEKFDYGSPVSDDERDQMIRKVPYELAREALILAGKLGPTPWKARLLLAKTDRFFGDFDSAYHRLTALLNCPQGRTPNNLFQVRRLRVWVAFLRAEKQRRDDGCANQESLTLLRESQKDLNDCQKFLDVERVYDIERQKRNMYHFLHDRLRSMVTLAEVELDLLVPDAAKTVGRAQRMLKPLNDYIESNGLTKSVPQNDLRYRLDRLNDGLHRLGRQGMASSG